MRKECTGCAGLRAALDAAHALNGQLTDQLTALVSGLAAASGAAPFAGQSSFRPPAERPVMYDDTGLVAVPAPDHES